MKFWCEGQMEATDATKTCCECSKYMSSPELVYVEFNLFQGSQPNPDELHPEPTGRSLCHKCGKYRLV